MAGCAARSGSVAAGMEGRVVEWPWASCRCACCAVRVVLAEGLRLAFFLLLVCISAIHAVWAQVMLRAIAALDKAAVGPEGALEALAAAFDLVREMSDEELLPMRDSDLVKRLERELEERAKRQRAKQGFAGSSGGGGFVSSGGIMGMAQAGGGVVGVGAGGGVQGLVMPGVQGGAGMVQGVLSGGGFVPVGMGQVVGYGLAAGGGAAGGVAYGKGGVKPQRFTGCYLCEQPGHRVEACPHNAMGFDFGWFKNERQKGATTHQLIANVARMAAARQQGAIVPYTGGAGGAGQ